MSEPGSHFIAGNVVNLYADPDSGSELVSQAILGMSVTAAETHAGFSRVTLDDRYTGWVSDELLVPAWDRTDFLQTGVATLFADVYSAPDAQSELITKLTVSTRVSVAHRPEVEQFVPVVLANHQVGYVHNVCLNITHTETGSMADLVDRQARRALDVGDLKSQVLRAVGRQAALAARRFIGTPYLWGGSTPFGIDCSGFVQLAYKLSGIQLLRDAHLQFGDRRFARADGGQGLDGGHWEAGDLLVFSRREDRRPTHIGLALGEDRFIHSLGGHGVCVHPCTIERFREAFVGAIRISPDADLAVEAA